MQNVFIVDLRYWNIDTVVHAMPSHLSDSQYCEIHCVVWEHVVDHDHGQLYIVKYDSHEYETCVTAPILYFNVNGFDALLSHRHILAAIKLTLLWNWQDSNGCFPQWLGIKNTNCGKIWMYISRPFWNLVDFKVALVAWLEIEYVCIRYIIYETHWSLSLKGCSLLYFIFFDVHIYNLLLNTPCKWICGTVCVLCNLWAPFSNNRIDLYRSFYH